MKKKIVCSLVGVCLLLAAFSSVTLVKSHFTAHAADAAGIVGCSLGDSNINGGNYKPTDQMTLANNVYVILCVRSEGYVSGQESAFVRTGVLTDGGTWSFESELRYTDIYNQPQALYAFGGGGSPGMRAGEAIVYSKTINGGPIESPNFVAQSLITYCGGETNDSITNYQCKTLTV